MSYATNLKEVDVSLLRLTLTSRMHLPDFSNRFLKRHACSMGSRTYHPVLSRRSRRKHHPISFTVVQHAVCHLGSSEVLAASIFYLSVSRCVRPNATSDVSALGSNSAPRLSCSSSPPHKSNERCSVLALFGHGPAATSIEDCRRYGGIEEL